jgi:tetrahydromethanopterin S-methyltransferase subunit G
MRRDMDSGFERVERRLGNIETRVETIEIDVKALRSDFGSRIDTLERIVGDRT